MAPKTCSKSDAEILSCHSVASYLHKLPYIFYQYKPLAAGQFWHNISNIKGRLRICKSKNVHNPKKKRGGRKHQAHIPISRGMKKRDGKEQEDRFILTWITEQPSNVIWREWLFGREVLRSLREPRVAKLDTVFVMWPGDKGTDICWHLLSAAGSK